MLIVEIIICILSLAALLGADNFYHETSKRDHILYIFFLSVSMALAFLLCIILFFVHWTVFAIPKLVLFASFYFYILFNFYTYVDEDRYYLLALIIIILAYICGCVAYYNNLEVVSQPDIEITKCDLVSAKDSISVEGEMHGGLFIQHGYVSEKPVYMYYYPLADGGFKSNTIPANDTTIYYLENGEKPYLETTVTEYYIINHNKKTEERTMYNSETTYKLFVPEGSIVNAYEFDAE